MVKHQLVQLKFIVRHVTEAHNSGMPYASAFKSLHTYVCIIVWCGYSVCNITVHASISGEHVCTQSDDTSMFV